MKNKGAFSVLLVYVILIILASFSPTLMTYIVSSLASLFKNSSNITLISNIIEYLIYFLIYFPFGMLLMYVLYFNIDTYIRVLIYTILILLFVIVLTMVIKSFFTSISYIKYIVKYGFCDFGAALSFLILEKKVKKL